MEALQTIDNEGEKLAVDFGNRYLNLMLQRKQLSKDVRVLRAEFEEQGLPTADVIKALNKIRTDKRAGDEKLEQIERFSEWLRGNQTVVDSLTELDAKS
jgi:hypothetical protein